MFSAISCPSVKEARGHLTAISGIVGGIRARYIKYREYVNCRARSSCFAPNFYFLLNAHEREGNRKNLKKNPTFNFNGFFDVLFIYYSEIYRNVY